ncbi:MAG: DUF1015 domain-containing protein [Nitrospiraceae bacterium]|nr:MAG: DUF1015 domain-containing protein [Nitrospiraceae bacterium]
MAEIIPFKGILYNPQKVAASNVMSPPYDIVTPQLKNALYARDTHNIVRIDFGKDHDGDNERENRYTRALQFMKEWLREGIFIKDAEPLFYCYEAAYKIHNQEKRLRGFLGAVRIEELGTGHIHPHEMKYSKPKSDRLNILRYCNANTSPIFSLYSSKERRTSSIIEDIVLKEPFLQAKDGDGFTHRIWRIDNPDSMETIQRELSDKEIFIADGHHRYETASAFKKEMEAKTVNPSGKESFNYVLMFLSNMEDNGLTLLPTHRLVEIDSDINVKETLRKYFNVQKISQEGKSEEQIRQLMFAEMHNKVHTFGMFLTNSDTYYSLSSDGKTVAMDLPQCLQNLDVSVLHRFIFEKLLHIGHFEYEMDPVRAVERAKKDSFEAVFFLNSTEIQEVRDVALGGERMPPKSTYFFPKLLTGMVMYTF